MQEKMISYFRIYRMKERSNLTKILAWAGFLCYFVLLLYLLFFAEGMGRTSLQNTGYRYNLEPFREISRFSLQINRLGFYAFLVNIIGNVVAFVPYGFFRPILADRPFGWGRTVLSGTFVSLSVELIQLLTKVGSFDVDDLLLNSIGCLLGYFVYAWFRRKRQKD